MSFVLSVAFFGLIHLLFFGLWAFGLYFEGPCARPRMASLDQTATGWTDRTAGHATCLVCQKAKRNRSSSEIKRACTSCHHHVRNKIFAAMTPTHDHLFWSKESHRDGLCTTRTKSVHLLNLLQDLQASISEVLLQPQADRRAPGLVISILYLFGGLSVASSKNAPFVAMPGARVLVSVL